MQWLFVAVCFNFRRDNLVQDLLSIFLDDSFPRTPPDLISLGVFAIILSVRFCLQNKFTQFLWRLRDKMFALNYFCGDGKPLRNFELAFCVFTT